MEKRKVSTFLANEEKKRLLKSGKDTLSYNCLAKMTAFLKNAAVFETKRGHVFFKRGRLFGGARKWRR